MKRHLKASVVFLLFAALLVCMIEVGDRLVSTDAVYLIYPAVIVSVTCAGLYAAALSFVDAYSESSSERPQEPK